MSARKFLLRGPGVEHHRALRARYHVLAHKPGEGFVENPGLPSIVLDNGKLIVGAVPVHTVRVTADHFTWVQQSPGRYTSGHIYTLHNGLDIHGVAYIGTSPSDAVEHTFVGTAAKPAKFDTWITKQSHPAATDPTKIPEGEWEKGPDLEITYETEIGEGLPKPKVKLGGVDLGDTSTTWSVGVDDATVLNIHTDDITCEFYPKLVKLAALSFDPNDFAVKGWGNISQLCSEAVSLKADVRRFWKAAPQATATLRAAPTLEAIAPQDIMPLSSDAPLDIKELVTLLPDDQIAEASKKMLSTNMYWAMGQHPAEKDWLKNFMAMEPPELDAEEKKLVTESLAFYQDKFAKAYLASGFQRMAGQGAPEHRLDSKQELKLTTFLSSGLAKEKDFTVQQHGIYYRSYRATHPRLYDYINDKNHDWAQELYKKLTDGPQFQLMVNRVIGCQGDPKAMAPVNNFACLLTALDPTGKKAKDYFNAVVTGVLQSQVPKVLHNKEELERWLPHTLEAVLRELAEGETQREGISKAEAEFVYQYYLKNASSATTGFANLLLSLSSTSLFDKAKEFEGACEAAFSSTRVAAFFGKLFLVVGWVTGLVSIIYAFAHGIKADWEKMTDPQKAKFVTGIAQTIITAFDAGRLVWRGIKFIWDKGVEFARAFWAKLEEALNDAPVINKIEAEADAFLESVGEDGGLISSGASETAPLIAQMAEAGEAGEEAVVATSRLWPLFAKAGVTVLKVFGAITAVAMAAWSLWTLIDDLTKNPTVTTKVFDSLIFIANTLAAVCIVTSLFVESTVIPIAGAILAIIGAIIAILAMFLEKPANPIDVWMVDVGIPFVNGLSDAKQEMRYDPYHVGLATA
jgi:uncharacterized membrane-anchored protein